MSRSDVSNGRGPGNEESRESDGGTGIAVALELLEEQASSKELGEYLANLRRRYTTARPGDIPEFIRAYLTSVG